MIIYAVTKEDFVDLSTVIGVSRVKKIRNSGPDFEWFEVLTTGGIMEIGKYSYNNISIFELERIQKDLVSAWTKLHEDKADGYTDGD